jgi:hypothetical protein
MRRLNRRPSEIETLNFHAAVDILAPGEQRLVSDPRRVDATVALFEAGLRDSLDSPSRIRGWISDQLFGLIAADLEGCLLVKQEDSGVLFYDDGVKLPDWRLTLASGASVLVEVKAVDDGLPQTARFRLSEVARLQRYAQLNELPLYLAVHWVSLSMWTLVPVEDLARVDDHFEIDLNTAFTRDHMGPLLNDRMLGLIPPLEFRMTLQQEGATASAPLPGGDPGGLKSKVSLVVNDVRMSGGGQEMIDDREKALVWFLLQHARWPCEETIEQVSEEVWEIVFRMEPGDEEAIADQEFAVIGRLSELYTRMFYSSTTSLEEGTTQLSIDVEPGTLPRLVPADLQSDRLPLWHLHLQPKANGLKESGAAD